MRWETLFAGLEAEAEGLAAEERDGEIAERTRSELARSAWTDRWLGRSLALEVTTPDPPGVVGVLERVGRSWLLVVDPHDRSTWVVATDAVAGVRGTPGPPTGVRAPGDARLGWPAVLRVLARDRAQCRVLRRAAPELQGVLGPVGSDWVAVSDYREDRPRGGDPVVVPVAAVAAVRTAGG